MPDPSTPRRLNLSYHVYLGANHTKYDTEDLYSLLSAVAGFSYTSGPRYSRSPRGLKHTGNDISTSSETLPYRVEVLYDKSSRLAAVGKKVIRIAPPRKIFESLPLDGLAYAGMKPEEGVRSLPKRAVGELAEAFLDELFGKRHQRSRTLEQYRDVAEWRAEVEEHLFLRVHPKTVDKKKAPPKKTQAEKIEAAWQRYGRGESIDYGFVRALERLSKQYNRELIRKRKWGEKLEKLGETPHPYESFPDFLRRIADQAEREKARWGTK